MNKPLIEACVDSYQSCVNAWKGGADRLELCAHLAIGGCQVQLSQPSAVFSLPALSS